jgi:hypothetical protein
VDSLRRLVHEDFELVAADNYPPHSVGRICSFRGLARKKPRSQQLLDKEKILRAYEARVEGEAKRH